MVTAGWGSHSFSSPPLHTLYLLAMRRVGFERDGMVEVSPALSGTNRRNHAF